MQRNYNYKKFTFCNNKEKLIAALDTILAYIRKALGSTDNADNIILRSKWILTELLTNASKHSNEDNIIFELCIKDEMLEITKLDYGAPFSVSINNERKYFPAAFIEKNQYVIHKDDLSILYANICKGVMCFKVEDVEIIHDNVLEINEHFGLIIITKSSDEFTYTYNSETKANTFTAKLNLI